MSENLLTLTPEELEQRLQVEGDKRVSSALATAKEKWKAEQSVLLEVEREKVRREAEEAAKLTAEERAKKELEEREIQLSELEISINKRTNTLEAQEMLGSAEIPKSHYEKFIGVLVSDDPKSTKTNVENFITMFNETKSDIESSIKAKLSDVPPPAGGQGGSKGVSKADFDKMSYSEKLKFKSEHPEEFKKFTR